MAQYVQQNADGSYTVVVDGQPPQTFSDRTSAENDYNSKTSGGGFVPGAGAAPSGPTGGATSGGIGDMRQRLQAAGYPGPWDDASVVAAFNRTVNGGNAGMPGGDWSSLWGALTNTNQQQFDWDKEKFNRDFAERVRQFNDSLGLSNKELDERIRQYDQSLGENKRQFDVGSDQWNRQFGEGQRQFNQNAYTNLSQGLLSGAASLRGPADWRKYAQYTGGGKDIFESIYGANPNPAFGAPAGYSPAISIADVLRQMGMLPGGQGNERAQIQPASGDGMVSIPENDPNFRQLQQRNTPPSLSSTPVRSPWWGQTDSNGRQLESAQNNPVASALSQAITPIAGAPSSAAGPQVPQPHQINPMVWDSLSNTAKQMILASAEAGDTSSGAWDPTDYLNQFEASRPSGQAPRRSQFNWSQGQSLF